MNDDQLAEVFLTELRDATSATHQLDLLDVAHRNGVDVHYAAHRVAKRLAEHGYVEDLGFSGQSLPARLTDRGRTALAEGSVRGLTEQAVEELELHGRTAEAEQRTGPRS